MDKLHIKKISEIDKNKLIEFYQKFFQYDQSLLVDYNWRYRTGFSSYEPLVLVNNNVICGHAGLIPIKIKNFELHEKVVGWK